MANTANIDRRSSRNLRREEDARLRALFDNALDAILIANADGCFVDANPAACALLGYSRAELLGLSVREVTPAGLGETDEAEWREFAALPGRRSGEYALRCKDGSERVVEYRAVAHFLPGLHLSVMRDITERREADRRLGDSARRLRQLSRRLFSVQEDERRRLARELHEDFGQQLTALKFKLAALKGEVATVEGRRRLADSLEIVERTLERFRDTALDLRPSVLDDLGLAAALHWYARRQGERAGCEIVVQDRLEPLPADLETAAFRIVQEGIGNALRHGVAGHIIVTAEIRGQELRLAIQDDGSGFDPAAVAASLDPGMGLGSMRERVELFGGRFAFASQPGAGALIEAAIPLPGAAS